MTDAQQSGLGHDLINSLGIIVGNCDLLLGKLNAARGEQANRIQQIRATALHMAEQLKDCRCVIETSEKAKTAAI